MVLLMSFLWVTVDMLVKAYLMTPILKPKNAGEVRYNTAHRHTRCVIERWFGLLKRRFRVCTVHRLGEYPRNFCGYCSVA